MVDAVLQSDEARQQAADSSPYLKGMPDLPRFRASKKNKVGEYKDRWNSWVFPSVLVHKSFIDFSDFVF